MFCSTHYILVVSLHVLHSYSTDWWLGFCETECLLCELSQVFCRLALVECLRRHLPVTQVLLLDGDEQQ